MGVEVCKARSSTYKVGVKLLGGSKYVLSWVLSKHVLPHGTPSDSGPLASLNATFANPDVALGDPTITSSHGFQEGSPSTPDLPFGSLAGRESSLALRAVP